MQQICDNHKLRSGRCAYASHFRQRTIFILVTFLFLPLCPLSHGERATTRESKLIDRGWTFHLGDVPGAESKAHSGAKREHSNLPHSFSIPHFLAPQVYSGYGWYRKNLLVSCANTKRHFLEFDGVFRVAEVYVNGRRIGEHSGGYTGFLIRHHRCIGRWEQLDCRSRQQPAERLPEPSATGQEAWCQIDFENLVEVERVEADFRDAHDRSFEVLESEDGSLW